MDWRTLFNIAKEKLKPRTISPFIDAGGVARRHSDRKGKMYTQVSVSIHRVPWECVRKEMLSPT